MNDLVDVLNALANKIDFFSSAGYGSDDGSDGEGQADAAQSQQQNTNAQNQVPDV